MPCSLTPSLMAILRTEKQSILIRKFSFPFVLRSSLKSGPYASLTQGPISLVTTLSPGPSDQTSRISASGTKKEEVGGGEARRALFPSLSSYSSQHPFHVFVPNAVRSMWESMVGLWAALLRGKNVGLSG